MIKRIIELQSFRSHENDKKVIIAYGSCCPVKTPKSLDSPQNWTYAGLVEKVCWGRHVETFADICRYNTVSKGWSEHQPTAEEMLVEILSCDSEDLLFLFLPTAMPKNLNRSSC